MATGAKRSLAEARRDAEAFRNLCDRCYKRWEIAGSVRRGKSEVADVEHVVVPAFADLPAGLFGEAVRTNLLLQRLDQLIAAGVIAKHLYGETRQTRWGEKYRGAEFRGFTHEVFSADDANYGCILAIRTGPAEFSEMMVTKLHGTLLRQRDGYLKYERDGSIYPCPTEVLFFSACNVPFRKPEDR